MKKRNVILGSFGLLLLISTIVGHAGWHYANGRIAELEKQLGELRQQEKRSAVLRSVSSQLEEIANQQKEISDEQREKAQEQTQLANDERQKALLSEQQAKSSELRAKESEQQAQEARLAAEKQQVIAEHQRIQAELSKSIADTLRYQALGRSLGSLATTQHQSGNAEIAELLAYAAYQFTNRYKGDIYNPAVLQALMTASQSSHTWPMHNGAVTALDFTQESNSDLASVSNFGELIRHHYQDGQLKSTVLIKDSTYDFRDVYMDEEGTIFTISRGGQFVIVPKKGHIREIQIQGVAKPFYLSTINEDLFAVIGPKGVAYMNMHTFKQLKTRTFDFNIVATGRNHLHPLIFDDKGYKHELVDMDKIETTKVPVQGRVTAFANSKNARLDAYGMSDGSIYVIDEHGNQRKLVGHRSRISRLKLNGTLLYSSSYDGTLNLWMITSDKNAKIDPMRIVGTGSWIMYFTTDASKQNMWIGDQKGNISRTLTSVQHMAREIRNRLKRNFTQEEWDYYIGKSVPYESFLKKKEGGGK